jgi:chaperonin GroEL
VLVIEKSLKQNQDIVPIIEMVYTETDHKMLFIIGKVDGQALETCALTNLKGKVKICVVKPPVYGDQELPFLEDVAVMTGGKVVPSSLAADKVTKEYLGEADKVIVTSSTTTIFGGHGAGEDVEVRIADLKKQLKSDKYSTFQKERMEMRLSKLQGKIGIIKVGGATETEMKEMKYRVEDAVHATRAAKEEGIVPGGATTLVHLSTLPLVEKARDEGLSPDEQEGVKVVLDALTKPFHQLMENAGEDGGYRLRQVLNGPPKHGFNVKNMTEEPIELVPAGVIDPARVVRSIIENACAAAGVAITIPVTVTIDREWQKDQINLNKALQQGG